MGTVLRWVLCGWEVPGRHQGRGPRGVASLGLRLREAWAGDRPGEVLSQAAGRKPAWGGGLGEGLLEVALPRLPPPTLPVRFPRPASSPTRSPTPRSSSGRSSYGRGWPSRASCPARCAGRRPGSAALLRPKPGPGPRTPRSGPSTTSGPRTVSARRHLWAGAGLCEMSEGCPAGFHTLSGRDPKWRPESRLLPSAPGAPAFRGAASCLLPGFRGPLGSESQCSLARASEASL